MSLEKAKARYTAALHAMQSGVLMLMSHFGIEEEHRQETYAKHLRVGVNAAMIDAGAVAKLCLAKGVFTEEEYAEALAELAEADKKSYETKLSALKGIKITLA